MSNAEHAHPETRHFFRSHRTGFMRVNSIAHGSAQAHTDGSGSRFKGLLTGICLCLAAAVISSSCIAQAADADTSWSFGPVISKYKMVISPAERLDILGPLYSQWESTNVTGFAIRPLFSTESNHDVNSVETDILYPLLAYDRVGKEARWQLFQLLNWNSGSNQEDEQTERFTIFPFYFQQRSDDPAQDYTAVFPFYGHLKDRFYRDEIDFVLFPLYSRTRKRDVVTRNFLYPFFHIRNGRELSGYQVWPLWGYEEKGITTRTNDFDQEITVGGHKKYFALWPLFFDHKTGIGTETPKKKQALLPLYSYERSPARDSTTVLWPLFTWTHDRARGYREWDAPWPFVVFARGEGKTANRVWPFYSHVETTNKESSFFLWPLYTSRKIHAEPLERTRNRVCFFLYSDIRETNTDTGRAKRRTDLWPVFSAKKSADGRERIQIGALLEPLIPGNSSIEKNFSPLWSLWVSEKNPETGKSRESLLWNLYQHQEAEDTEEWSFLFGLFKYKSGNSGNRLRLFYIPLGGNETPVDSD